jgi:hypothetical protein
LCCREPETDTQWRNCRFVDAARKEGNFCEACCPADTIRMGMEKPEEYESCKSGGHAICCEPRSVAGLAPSGRSIAGSP